jgi:P4 family phage/plasmid primase-like protien
MTNFDELDPGDYWYCYNCKKCYSDDWCSRLGQAVKYDYCCANFEFKDTPITIEEYTKKLKKTALQKLQEEKKQRLAYLTDYMKNAQEFYIRIPYFYDRSGLFWIWNDDEHKYVMTDEVDVLNYIEAMFGFAGLTIEAKVKNSYIEAFKRYGRQRMPKDTPKRWIQFKDKAFSLRSSKVHQITPDFFFTNPIPWEVGAISDTPIMDSLIESWVGKEYVNTVYEIISYCCYSDYPIQSLLCFYGFGRNGKSCLLRIIKKFIGPENVCSTQLDLIAGNNRSRFETFKMYKKLVCQMGETNFGLLNNSSILKQLVGGDMIGVEKKGKDPFDFMNYSKILIASNSLPITKDQSDGFFRRWIIIPFNNEFPEGKDILEIIPEVEYLNLAKKVTEILPKLLDRGTFTNQGSIEKRKKDYIAASNPFTHFLEERCLREPTAWIKLDDFYNAYIAYLMSKKNRKVGYKDFLEVMAEEGLTADRTSKRLSPNDEFTYARFVSTVAIRPEFVQLVRVMQDFPYSTIHVETSREKSVEPAQNAQDSVGSINEEYIGGEKQ